MAHVQQFSRCYVPGVSLGASVEASVGASAGAADVAFADSAAVPLLSTEVDATVVSFPKSKVVELTDIN